jgi:hypothetical protein
MGSKLFIRTICQLLGVFCQFLAALCLLVGLTIVAGRFSSGDLSRAPVEAALGEVIGAILPGIAMAAVGFWLWRKPK